MGLDNNFYNYFLETAVKIIVLSLAEKKIANNLQSIGSSRAKRHLDQRGAWEPRKYWCA